MGGAAVRDVLVGAMGVGDEPDRVSAERHFLAHAGARKSRRARVCGLWRALGSDSADQSDLPLLPSLFLFVGMVETEKAFREGDSGATAGGHRFCGRNLAVAGAELQDIRAFHFPA